MFCAFCAETLLVMCSHPHWGIASRACNILATLDSSSILPISVDVMCIAESLFTRYLQESDMLSFKVVFVDYAQYFMWLK